MLIQVLVYLCHECLICLNGADWVSAANLARSQRFHSTDPFYCNYCMLYQTPFRLKTKGQFEVGKK